MPDASVVQRPTLRCILSGFLLSVLLCGVNSYLTLSFGVIEEGPTIAALFFFAFFFLSRTAITTSEMTIVATMGSAGGSLGFITNFFAAKVMATGTTFTLLEMAGFAMVTSLVGLLFTIPLRDLLILKEDLPWPGSKAVKAVIDALTTEGDKRQPYYLLATCVVAIAYVVMNDDGGFAIVPEGTPIAIFGLAAYGAAISWSPFAIGGAYLMGLRTCIGFGFGGVLLLVLAPRLPEPSAPHRYIWPGMGFLLATGLTNLVINWRVVVDAIKSLVALKKTTDDDDPIMGARGFRILAAIAVGIAVLHGTFVMDLNVILIVILILLGGFLQNIIATRAAAQTAFNPARVMGVLLQGACALGGAHTAAQNLVGAGYVAGSGAQAGMLTADLAYGRWLKIPSRWQFWAQTATILPCAFVAAWVFQQIAKNYPMTLEGGLPAPVAKMWAASALIFEGKNAMPPFATEAMLIAGAIGIAYVLLERSESLKKFLPDSIGLGLGLVLPISYDFAFFLGGIVLFIVLARGFKIRDITLTTIAVGCIVAEGIGGVLKSALSVAGVIPH